ncbi:LanC-like protein 3 [Monoraphidium neglectum]|uniref:LanC-like protein 3 n=1 Tax=Monoraphidium neglectum TaxID=145388 RepID=A0A0D2MYL4_9CHLO|nr:LanC-like protein 3 [Monoraphidium neglectum]KIZ05452.1 LanC-like protein 3 [Monoraphidium neglectum]|eukprot:XP_013904471.1 LanC-like protein 3 [Monoraphidium neglectum]
MRYHLNTAAAAGAAAALPECGARLNAALADVKAAVVAAAPAISGSTVYTGAAGVAYALARASRTDTSLLPLAAHQAAAAAARPGLRRRVPDSVMDGQAGVALVQAVLCGAAQGFDPWDLREAPLARFAACCGRAASPDLSVSDEVLYGRSGTLLGALMLNQQLGRKVVADDHLTAICAAILHSGLEASLPGRPTAGGHWPVMCALGSAEVDDTPLVHWCHSSPGVAMMAAKAFQVTGSRRYLAAAVSAGELVWKRGLLTKGPGLRHGVSATCPTPADLPAALLKAFLSTPKGWPGISVSPASATVSIGSTKVATVSLTGLKGTVQSKPGMAAAKVKAIAGVVTTRSALANLSPFNLAGQALAIAGSGCTLRAINKNTQLAFSCPNIQVQNRFELNNGAGDLQIKGAISAVGDLLNGKLVPAINIPIPV